MGKPAIIYKGSPELVIKKLVDMLYSKQDSLKKQFLNPTVCFDVDECLVEWVGEHSIRRHDMIPLFNAVRDLGFTRYVITARPKTRGGLVYLREQLGELGFKPSEFAQLYMMPREYDDPGVFKSDARAHIIKKIGCDLILMAGDQATDVYRNPDTQEPFDPTLAYIVANPDDGLLLGLKLTE